MKVLNKRAKKCVDVYTECDMFTQCCTNCMCGRHKTDGESSTLDHVDI